VRAYSFQVRFGPDCEWIDASAQHVYMERAAVEAVCRRSARDWNATHAPVLEQRIVVLTPTAFEPVEA